jgi:hypothetical protein
MESKMNINVIRQQWPIGQGCFANGSISTDNRTFTYVYDCGSNNLNPLRQSIRQLDPNNNLIDALFISHLDSDHVNGIDFLCSSCGYSVDTVYLPYLSIIDCLIIIGASLANDSFTWNLAEAVINPRKWFKQRGVNNLVMIRRRDPDDQGGPELPEEPGPFISPDEKKKMKDNIETDHRLMSFVSPYYEKTYMGNINKTALSIAASKSVVYLSRYFDAPIWILVPFVPPLPEDSIKAFLARVRKELRLNIRYGLINTRKNNSRIMTILRDQRARKKLKTAYNMLVRHHNSVSLCLYSGPCLLSSDKVYWDVMSPKHDYMFYNRVHPVRKYGWIGTGDLTLNLEHHLDAFRNHYGTFSDKISTLLLPHHGSQYSFSYQLGKFCMPEISLVSAGLRNRYGHPHHGVIGTMRLLGSQVYNVTEKPSSTVIEEIQIER